MLFRLKVSMIVMLGRVSISGQDGSFDGIKTLKRIQLLLSSATVGAAVAACLLGSVCV